MTTASAEVGGFSREIVLQANALLRALALTRKQAPMASLSDRARAYLAKLEPSISGQGGHTALLAAARVAAWDFGLDAGQALRLLREFNETRCDPPWPESELHRKIRETLNYRDHRNPRGHLFGTEVARPIAPIATGQLPKPEPTWPKPDLEAIDRIVSAGSDLYDLWEQSPVRFDDDRSHTEEIIDLILPGNPLICCAKDNRTFATRRREVWRGRLATLPLMVPNPMVALYGKTQDGRWSEHTKHATAARVYQVIEFDFSQTDRSGNDALWTPLVRRWQESGITVLDACAALTLHLVERLPTLASVCFSGGKSLHAWFRVFELTKLKQREFMRYAVSLGADRATWNKAQFVRIPDGLRPNGGPQICYYLNSREAVKL